MGRDQKRTFYASAVLTALSLIMVVAGIFPGKAELVRSSFQVSGGGIPRLGAGTIPPGVKIPSYLTGSFLLRFPGSIKGRRIAITKVIYFSEAGKQLGSVPVTQVSRQVRVRSTGQAQGQPSAPTVSPLEPVQGVLFLWPLEKTDVTFPAVSQKTFEIKPGQKIYAEVEGKMGIRKFRVKSVVSAAAGLGF